MLEIDLLNDIKFYSTPHRVNSGVEVCGSIELF